MSKNKTEIPEEALKLLPWYATGWLSNEERAYIQDILAKHPELQEQLDIELEIIDIIAKDKSILNLSSLDSPENRLDKVFETIDNTPKLDKKNKSSFKNLLGSWFLPPFSLQYASLTVVSVLTISLLFAFVVPLVNQKSNFHPATSTEKSVSQKSTPATILLVGLNGDPELLKTLDPLKNKLEKIDSVPGKKGMYRVSFKDKLIPEQTKELIEFLVSQKDMVWFAGEAY